MAATASDVHPDKYLTESLRRFCRSIELCDDYLRGYYGLKLVCSTGDQLCTGLLPNQIGQTSGRLLKSLSHGSRPSKSGTSLSLPDVKTVERLNEIATSKLSEIVRKFVANESGYQGYDSAEIIAAHELLNRESASIIR